MARAPRRAGWAAAGLKAGRAPSPLPSGHASATGNASRSSSSVVNGTEATGRRPSRALCKSMKWKLIPVDPAHSHSPHRIRQSEQPGENDVRRERAITRSLSSQVRHRSARADGPATRRASRRHRRTAVRETVGDARSHVCEQAARSHAQRPSAGQRPSWPRELHQLDLPAPPSRQGAQYTWIVYMCHGLTGAYNLSRCIFGRWRKPSRTVPPRRHGRPLSRRLIAMEHPNPRRAGFLEWGYIAFGRHSSRCLAYHSGLGPHDHSDKTRIIASRLISKRGLIPARARTTTRRVHLLHSPCRPPPAREGAAGIRREEERFQPSRRPRTVRCSCAPCRHWTLRGYAGFGPATAHAAMRRHAGTLVAPHPAWNATRSRLSPSRGPARPS
jgi:hypothetical protein